MTGDPSLPAVQEGHEVYREIHDALGRMALVSTHQSMRLVPLAGGVSSDIWRVEVPGATFCVKRALARLKVAADWRAPVGRRSVDPA